MEALPVPPTPPITFVAIAFAPKNTAQNIPSAKRADHDILPNIASKATPIINYSHKRSTYSPNVFNGIAYYFGGCINTISSTAHMRKGNK
ncbi:hypothetical protein IHO40_04540 [Wolbachia endosymbiont of Mansonella ozzardi]|nr:hypothetical protein [Wolbachia endosymbiont of Mansonella ozzardi]